MKISTDKRRADYTETGGTHHIEFRDGGYFKIILRTGVALLIREQEDGKGITITNPSTPAPPLETVSRPGVVRVIPEWEG